MIVMIPVDGPFFGQYDAPERIYFDDHTFKFTLQKGNAVRTLTVEELQDGPFEHPQQRAEAQYLLRYINRSYNIPPVEPPRNNPLLLLI